MYWHSNLTYFVLVFSQDHAPGRSGIDFHLPYNEIVLFFMRYHLGDLDPLTPSHPNEPTSRKNKKS